MLFECPKCHKMIDSKSDFCSQCGADLRSYRRDNTSDSGSNQGYSSEDGGSTRGSQPYSYDGGSEIKGRVADAGKKASEVGKKASEAARGGFEKVREGLEERRRREEAFTQGTGAGFTSNDRKTITGIQLVEGEKMVRTYHCTTYGFFVKRKGYLTVTNKRVIFESASPTSRIVNEVALDSVAGFRNFYGTNVFVLGLILAVIMVFLGLGLATSSFSKYSGGFMLSVMGLAIVALGVLLIYISIRKNVVISVFSSKASGLPIEIGEGPKTLFGNGALYSMVGRPTPETNTMMREIGAMVQDLQTIGDLAIEKWSV